ncbi:MAG: extracellular catalytic domain type 1 short-chain-length polyhydroxyalkanoate depolymerase [Planctomycetaceae bacterium]
MCSILALCVLMADEPAQLVPGDHRRDLVVGGLSRNYLVHVPPSYDGKKPVAVVLAFHGGGSNAAQMVQFCGLNDKSDAAGFAVVYPNGTGLVEGSHTWNAGNCCGFAQRRNIDDVAFTQALLDDLAHCLRVDADRVFATGMSNGAMIVYRLADRLSDRIAAIAPVGGPMGTPTCAPVRPVSVVHFHGTDDKFAPFGGGRGERSLTQTEFFSVEQSLANWVRANGCPETPETTPLEDVARDGTKVTRKTYGPGREGAQVVLYEIAGAGHTWPGRKPSLLFLGKTTLNVSANDVMWEFFERHPRGAAQK